MELAYTVNAEMPRYVVERVSVLLNERGKPIRGSRILGIGVCPARQARRTHGVARNQHPGLAGQAGGGLSYHAPLVLEVQVVRRDPSLCGPRTRGCPGRRPGGGLHSQDRVAWHLIAPGGASRPGLLQRPPQGPVNVFSTVRDLVAVAEAEGLGQDVDSSSSGIGDQ
jgi:hypothetical protein